MKAHLLLTHGAGASCQSDFMQSLTMALQQYQIQVSLFNFSYMQQRLAKQSKRPPPRAALLVAELADAIRAMPADLPLFVAGKSMGGRVATLWAAQQANVTDLAESRVKAVFAYGYPFHPPKQSTWRTEHFADLRYPLQIIQGERDPFGTKEELLGKTWKNVRVEWLNAADHDFVPLKKTGLTQQQLITQAAQITNRVIDAILT